MEEAEPSDGLLMRAFLSGDKEAFGRLYDRYDRQCFHFIRRILGPSHRDATEDVHQETWMSAAANGAQYDQSRSAFGTWLLTIARNKVLDHLRRQKVASIRCAEETERRADVADDAPIASEQVRDAAPTPLESLESRRLGQAMILAVDALPFTQREVFVLFAVSGMSLEEIAIATQVGSETVKSRLRYARAALTALAPWRVVDA